MFFVHKFTQSFRNIDMTIYPFRKQLIVGLRNVVCVNIKKGFLKLSSDVLKLS